VVLHRRRIGIVLLLLLLLQRLLRLDDGHYGCRRGASGSASSAAVTSAAAAPKRLCDLGGGEALALQERALLRIAAGADLGGGGCLFLRFWCVMWVVAYASLHAWRATHVFFGAQSLRARPRPRRKHVYVARRALPRRKSSEKHPNFIANTHSDAQNTLDFSHAFPVLHLWVRQKGQGAAELVLTQHMSL
jgi:hypothetical protein